MSYNNFLSYLQQLLTMVDPNDPYSVALAKGALSQTIPPTVEYALAERGRTLIPALESVYKWAENQMAERK